MAYLCPALSLAGASLAPPCSVSTSRSSVGSRAGAVFCRPGLSVAPRFLWECLISPTVSPSPTPATSNGAGGFPALRSPVRFTARLMWPIRLAALSAVGSESHHLLHLSQPKRVGRPSPWGRSSFAGLADRWASLSSRPCLPCCRKNDEQQGPFAPRALPRLDATTDPSATLSSSADLPVVPVIRPTQLPPFRAGTKRVSPVARRILVVVPSLTTPPEQPTASIGCGKPCSLRPHGCGLGLRNCTYEATLRSRSLRPNNSRSPSR